ncbi:MAG: hypothetical protein KDK07_18375 [Bauldia sp.]|nr:hypothetical protein [Bauldia sp.]
MATKPLRKYIICSSQRSGSKLYCQLLKMTGVLGAPSEFLVLSKVEARAAEAGENDLARIVLGRLAEKASPSGIAGVKLHFHEFSALTGRVPLESFGGFDVWVYIDRRDRAAQAVSLATAWQTNQFSSRKEATGEAAYSFELISKAVDRLDEDKIGWRRYFDAHDIRPHGVIYEDVMDEPERSVSIVLDAFGVAAENPIRLADVRSEIQRTDETREWAERYRAERIHRGMDPI